MLNFFLSKALCSSKRRVSIENAQKDVYIPKDASSNDKNCDSLSDCDGNYIWYSCDSTSTFEGIASRYSSLGATVEGIVSANPGVTISTLAGLTIKVPVRKPKTVDNFVRMFDPIFDQSIVANGSFLVSLCYASSYSRTRVATCYRYIKAARYTPNLYVDKYCNVKMEKLDGLLWFFNANEGTSSEHDLTIRKYTIDGKAHYAAYLKSIEELIDPGYNMITDQNKNDYENVAYVKTDEYW